MAESIEPAPSSSGGETRDEGFEPAIFWVAGALAAASPLMLAGAFLPGFGPAGFGGFVIGLCAATVLALRAFVALVRGEMLSCALSATLLLAGGAVFLLAFVPLFKEAMKPTRRKPIPAALALDQPTRLPPTPDEGDSFRTALLAALDRPASEDASLVASLPSLTALARENPALLRRHLDASAAWRVYEREGRRYATRRWRTPDGWRRITEGHHPEAASPGVDRMPWHFAVNLYLDGLPWPRQRPEAVRFSEGPESREFPLGRRGRLDYSFLEIECGPVRLEIAEESLGRERRLTKAALAELEEEFRALRERGVFAPAALPPDSVRREAPALGLYIPSYRNSAPESYVFLAWLNPGEPGEVWLKAADFINGWDFPEWELRRQTFQRVGWSDDPAETFLVDGGITLSESLREEAFAYRIEVWFKPDSGAPKRLLMSRAYRLGVERSR